MESKMASKATKNFNQAASCKNVKVKVNCFTARKGKFIGNKATRTTAKIAEPEREN